MKKGFTLIEVISAVVILSIIALIVIPIVNRNISESREKLYNRQVVTIEQAAQKWFALNSDNLSDDSFPYSLTLATLKSTGLIEKGDVKNPKDDTFMTGCVLIAFNNAYSQYTYEYKDVCPADEPDTPDVPDETPNYVTSGLLVWYDGIANDGFDNTHKDNTSNLLTWKDLSGNGNDGVLTNITLDQDSGWGSNYLHLDGVNDFVNIGELNRGNITIEIVLKYDVLGVSVPMGNPENGGYYFSINNNLASFRVYVDGTEATATSTTATQIDKMYSLSGSYDSINVNFYENAIKYSIIKPGNIGTTANNTRFIIGANPAGATPTVSQFLNGKVYSVRVYNRALTETEVLNNYQVDRDRFGF